MIDPQTKVIAQVIQERKNQDRQWGGPTHDDAHTVNEWVCYMDHQIYLALRPKAEDRRQRFIKIAALAVAAVESLDRKSNELDTMDSDYWRCRKCDNREPHVHEYHQPGYLSWYKDHGYDVRDEDEDQGNARVSEGTENPDSPS